MEPEEKQISVWICQEEKLISGLSKRTTCSDVVRVLLDDSKQGRRRRQQQQQLGSLQECGGGMLSGPPHSYCIVEKWRGFERILPNKTKILRLWAAWGDEQENVRFVLVRSEASLPNTGPRSAEARVVPSKDSPCQHGLGAAARRASLALSQERQRRVVRKAFRKLAKINKRKGGQPPHEEEPPAKEASSSAAERMETLVHLVLSQDHTIRQQIKRIRDLDREIDRYEARIHFDRMKRHGVNYVQDTYLVGGELEPPDGEAEPPAEEEEAAEEAAAAAGSGSEGGLEEYARQCEQVVLLQQQWRRQEELIEQLAGEIQEELNERWMKRRREELAAARGSSTSLSSDADCNTTELIGGGELHVEQERVKTQLSTSLYIGLRLSTDLDAVKADLELTQHAWADKERELRGLLDSLRILDVDGDGDGCEAPQPLPLPLAQDSEGPGPGPAEVTSGAEIWGEQAARGLRKDCEDNDEDSDTGLSSMHSQDSDSVPVCESLV
ncbi:Ras association domain-containing protein 10 [Varanus komodoensis]|uniref:ras association domain-containing protein 10 n=1 Tax=Varanus komodoensis TaxID=61221 RepID=UPI001CF7E5AB|nr:ras association domain-containing protein 10 [Varanus komodoensis]KAF7245345.1 Ras association domain-containing protein 10 [Varanus komodoensis]